MLDVLPAFAGDDRVALVFTVVPGSDFGGRLPSMLDELGAYRIPWGEAVRTRANLALAASPNGDLHRLRVPLVLVPHGAGFNKRLRDVSDPGVDSDASGLSSRQLLRRGRVTASVIGLAHPDQIGRLAASCPQAAHRARVIGDPCLDRMLAGQARRASYREALGASAGRRLVFVSSTWGPRSLYGGLTELPARLLAELPYDDYRLALALHPNVWATHRPWQLHQWLSDALDAGLLLLGPEEGWRAAVVAADLVIADHGSVPLYAAALDRPVLMAGDSGDEIVAGTPITTLAAAAPALDSSAGLRDQVERAIGQYRPGSLRGAADQAFALTGGSMAALRSLLYGLLDLAEPQRPVTVRAVPVPAGSPRPVPALQVRTVLERRSSGEAGDAIRVERFPVAVNGFTPAPPDDGSRLHLLVDVADCDELRPLQSATILLCRGRPAADRGSEARAADGLAAELLAGYPRCRAVAVLTDPAKLSLSLRDGVTVRVTLGPAGTRSSGSSDAAIAASALYERLRGAPGRPLLTPLTVRSGERRILLTPESSNPHGPP